MAVDVQPGGRWRYYPSILDEVGDGMAAVGRTFKPRRPDVGAPTLLGGLIAVLLLPALVVLALPFLIVTAFWGAVLATVGSLL